jgi:hypothetical protein
MAHYAFLDENNIVTEVITGVDETELVDGKDPETWYGEFRNQRCVRTSYNANIRKNYAGVGYVYDEERDAFIPPKPFNSWLLNEETCQWESPVPYPEDDQYYLWDEESESWIIPSN